MELFTHTELANLIQVTKEVITPLPEKIHYTQTKVYMFFRSYTAYVMISERTPPKGLYFIGPKTDFFDIGLN